MSERAQANEWLTQLHDTRKVSSARIAKLESALHEALNWWSVHDTGTDTDATFIRLRAVADAKVVLP